MKLIIFTVLIANYLFGFTQRLKLHISTNDLIKEMSLFSSQNDKLLVLTELCNRIRDENASHNKSKFYIPKE